MRRSAVSALLCFMIGGCYSETSDVSREKPRSARPHASVARLEPSFDTAVLTDLVQPVDPQRGTSGRATFADGSPVAFSFLVLRLKLAKPAESAAFSDHWYVSTVTDGEGRFTVALPDTNAFTGVATAVDSQVITEMPRWQTTVQRAQPGQPLTLVFENRGHLRVDVKVAKLEPELGQIWVRLTMNNAVSGEHSVGARMLSGTGVAEFGNLCPGNYQVVVQFFQVQHLKWSQSVTLGSDPAERSQTATFEIPEQRYGEVVVSAIEPDGKTPARWGDVRVDGPREPSLRRPFVAGEARLKFVPAGQQTMTVTVHRSVPVQVKVNVKDGVVTNVGPIVVEADPKATAGVGWNSPKLEEKTAAEWLRQFQSGPNASERAKAADALKLLGLTYRDGVMALIAALDDPDRHTRFHAAAALAKFGPDLGNAIDDWLIQAMRESAVANSHKYGTGQHRGMLLHGLRQAAVPALMVCLSDSRRIVRENAMERLRNLDHWAKPSIPLLRLIMANRRDPNLRVVAANTLIKIKGADEQFVAVLLESLQLPVIHSGTWCSAAASLAKLGSRAKLAVPALIEILSGQRERLDRVGIYIGPPFPLLHVRAVAAETLGRIGPDAKEAVPALIEAAQPQPDAPDERTAASLRIRVAQALWRIDPKHPQALPLILAGLKDDRVAGRLTLATIIEVGPPAKDAVPALIEILNSGDVESRRLAARACAAIGPEARDAIAALIDRLKDEQIAVQREAAKAFGAIGPASKSAIPKLLDALKATHDRRLKQYLAESLRKIDPEMDLKLDASGGVELPERDGSN